MLRARVRGRTRTVNVVSAANGCSFSHGLGVVPNKAWVVSFSGAAPRGCGRCVITAIGTNRICVTCSAVSTCTVDIFCIADEAAGIRLY